jgi:hypothetical protein
MVPVRIKITEAKTDLKIVLSKSAIPMLETSYRESV